MIKNLFLIAFLLSVSVIACKKGDTGSAGPAGPAGPTGTQGANGNANITMYQFGSQTFTSLLNLTLQNISKERIDSSLILAYYNPSTEAATSWYPIPGSGSGALYETRYFVSQLTASPSSYTFGIRLLKADGTLYTTQVTFTKIKVIVAPASTIINGRVNLSDYQAVMNYYNLAE